MIAMNRELDSFPLFGRLPAELRLEIWRHSCQARVVEVFYDAKLDACSTSTAPPPLLHACRESRAEAQRTYAKSFGTASRPAHIYFNPSIDVLYLPRRGVMGYDDAARDFRRRVDDADGVRTLAIDHVDPDIRRPWEAYNKFALIQSFSRLAEVFLVLAADDDDDGGAGSRPRRGSELEFVAPERDPTDISRLLADVYESFCFEIFSDSPVGAAKEPAPKSPPLVPKSKMIQC